MFFCILIGLIFLLAFIRSDGGRCVSNPCGYCKQENPGVSITRFGKTNEPIFDLSSFNISEVDLND